MERGFKIVKGYENENINLPKRATKHSAGYDFEAAEDIVVPANSKAPTFVKTGIKAYMKEGETLFLFNRSSNPKKRGLILANSVGVIDKDYFENPDNDGHIMFAFLNIKDEDEIIKKGERIGQGVFMNFFIADEDNAEGEREGGFGSTN